MQAVSTLRFKTNLGDYGQPVIKPFLFDGTVFIITTGCGFFSLKLADVYDGWNKAQMDTAGCNFFFNFRPEYRVRWIAFAPTLG
jgi:hypothetical protein